MTISNNNIILANDLNSALTGSLLSMAADNNHKPAVTWFTTTFQNLVASSTLITRTRNIVMPDDFLIAEICVAAGIMNGTITVTIDNDALIEPIVITKTGVNIVADKLDRYYLASAGHPLQLFLKGSELQIIAETTDTNDNGQLQVSIGFVHFLRRN